MANVFDYLEWRGDMTLESVRFNEIDNLIFSLLSYVDLADIGAEGEELDITVKKAAEKYMELHPESNPAGYRSFMQKTVLLLFRAARCERFCDLKLSRYVNIIDYNEEKQFSALTTDLGNGLSYIAFRGTDNTLVGWKEDFNLGFRASVPAQREAVRYLEETAGRGTNQLILGGHSKGGNLAVYAAAKCSQTVQERIVAVYNNDGPGFIKGFADSAEYHRIRGRIKTIVPQSSVVGMLLEHDEEYRIIKSNQVGLMQHDAFSWQVTGARFVHLENVTNGSKMLDETLKAWIGAMSDAQREKFVEGLFSILTNAGVETIDELNSEVLRHAFGFAKSMHTLDRDTKQTVQQTIKALLAESRHVFLSDILSKSGNNEAGQI